MSLKKYFPFESLVYKSSLHKKELIEYFSQKIEEKKSFGINNTKSTYSKPYIGKIIGDKFEIERAIEYRNSFLPQIEGEILEDFNGSKINIKMKMKNFVVFFSIFWLGTVSLICLAILFYVILNPQELAKLSSQSLPILIPFVMFIFGITLIFGGFKVESRKSRKDLEDLLNAKIVKNRFQ